MSFWMGESARSKTMHLKAKENIMINLRQGRNSPVPPGVGRFSVLILLAVVAPLRADNPPTFLTQFGSAGGGNGQFDNPIGIAVDSSNNVYVTDVSNDRVQKFTSSGIYLTQWGGYGGGNGQFVSPQGIAVDSSNNVYVTDGSNQRVEKFTSSGRYLTQWGSYGSGNGQFVHPYGIAVDSSNKVYVTDPPNSRVEKFDSSGRYLAQCGSYGSGNGQFGAPTGVAVDSSNNVYVVDSPDSRVKKFDSSGTYLAQFGSVGAGNGQFENPIGIAADSSNNVYVADSGNKRVEKFDRNGNYLAQLGSYGSGIGQFLNPEGVAVDNTGNIIYVTDVEENRVEIFGDPNLFLILTGLAALVTTQPASGLSATGAALNGSVIVGPDETVAWFDWGTDTNYGNITGATIVPGNSGSNSISTSLSGLPGNVYHYRLDATNDFGIVYGQDQSFTVGFAPGATTLAAINSGNGSTLQATVNPEGWDTTVYFQWETPTLTNTTPGIDIGAGAASVNVSSFVPGLSASATYQYQVVASNALGTAFGAVAWDPNHNHYLFSGSKTNITLNPGTYIITAYGAPGGGVSGGDYVGPGFVGPGSYGAEMSAEFDFSTSTTLTLLVGGGGVGGPYSGGGGGGSFAVNGSTPLVIAGGGGGGADAFVDDVDVYSAGGTGIVFPDGNGGDGAIGFGIYPGGGGGGFLGFGFLSSGGGGSGGRGFGGGGGGDAGGGGGGGYSGGEGGGGYGTYYEGGYGVNGYGGFGGGSIIDSSAITNLAEVSGIASPDDSTNGEIIIITVPPPPLAISTTGAAFGFTNGVFGFNVSGPSGASVVIQASTDLKTWIPLQTNLLGSGPLYFSDPQSTNNVQRFYRAQLSP